MPRHPHHAVTPTAVADRTAPPPPPPPPDANRPSLPASISKVLEAGASDLVPANGAVVARGLEGGDAASLGFVAGLTPYDEVQGSALV